MSRSPQQVDPLSWFTGPIIPLMFGGIAIAYAVFATVASTPVTPRPLLQWLAVGILVVACAMVVWHARIRATDFIAFRALVPIALAWSSLVLSAIGYFGGKLQVNWWWAPVTLSLFIALLAPYFSASRMILVGSLSFLVTVGTLLLVFPLSRSIWPPLTLVLSGSGTVAIGAAASAVFSHQVAMRVNRWSGMTRQDRLSSGVLGEATRLRLLRRELTQLSERALPLLRGIAEAGIVTSADQQAAAVLAAKLRTELVERVNRSWLDTVAPKLRLTVIDPDHQADLLSKPQRSALLGLLRAAMDSSEGATFPIVIELRSEPDGSTAVALSTDVQLLEGRRVMLLAPHYLTLKAAVDDSAWSDQERLAMTFKLTHDRRPKL